MRNVILSILMLIFSGPANAEYFFTANDVVITKCAYTSMKGVNNIKTALESGYGVKCTALEDNVGTVIVTRKKNLTNMIFVTRTEIICNDLRNNIRTITGN